MMFQDAFMPYGPPDLTVPGFGVPIGSAYFRPADRRAEGTV